MKRIGILVVAYNAASTLAQVFDRIPGEFRSQIHEVLVGDDHSQDSTYLVGLGYKQTGTDLPLTIVRHPENLGYGGNQKWGYQYAMEHGWDAVVLLHGDGQYAPELLAAIVEPILEGRAEAVFGSRMLHQGEARRGGMPAYKYVGNRILTTFQNAVVGTELSEWHSGYRAYDVRALARLPLNENSDGFNFDTEIIIQLHEAGFRIEEVPIPTYYGDEICYVDGMKYAKDVTKDVLRYRAHKMGFGTGAMAFASSAYDMKDEDDTSHARILAWMEMRPPARVLDLGCSDGALGARLAAMGHEVVGVDAEEHKGVRDRLADFFQADLDDGIPDDVGSDFDVVLAADVLEHVRQPERVLADARLALRAGGSVITSIPNFGHWYPRTRVALGRFDYDARGILDRGHVRFFTKRSFAAMVASAGWEIRRTESIGLPLEVVDRGGKDGGGSGGRAVIGRIDRAAIGLRPQLFAYQFLYEARANIVTVRAADDLFASSPAARLVAARSLSGRVRRKALDGLTGWPEDSPGALNAWLLFVTTKPPMWREKLLAWPDGPLTLGEPHDGFLYPDPIGFWAEVRRWSMEPFRLHEPRWSTAECLALTTLVHVGEKPEHLALARSTCRPRVTVFLDEPAWQSAELDVATTKLAIPDPHREGQMYEGWWGTTVDGAVVGKAPQHPTMHRVYRSEDLSKWLQRAPRPR